MAKPFVQEKEEIRYGTLAFVLRRVARALYSTDDISVKRIRKLEELADELEGLEDD